MVVATPLLRRFDNVNTTYREFVASRIAQHSDMLARRWLESLKSIVMEDTRDIFPTEQYLDHIPSMIVEIGKIISEQDIDLAQINSLITRKALELGSLRHEQNATVNQLLREYDLLAQHLEAYVCEITRDYEKPLHAEDMMHTSNSIHSVVRRILQDTVDSFVSKYVSTIEEQTEKLLHFNRFIGHEIRTPLQSALLNVDLILDDNSYSPDDTEALQDVKSAVEQVVTIMNNVETLVEPAALSVVDDPARQTIGIAELATDIIDQLQQSISDQEVQMIMDDDLGVLTTDTGKLRLILSNLMSNAIKYSDPNRPDSYVHLSRQDIGNQRVRLVVEDNGIGISEESLSNVTELKVRAYEEEEHQPPVEGHGIGLFLVDEAVKFLDGEMSLESKEGVGTIVNIDLPDNQQSRTV